MKDKTKMYRELIQKRLYRKKTQLQQLEATIQGAGVVTSVEKIQYTELKAVVLELENILDMAETVL